MKKDNLVKHRCPFDKRDIANVYIVFSQVAPNLFPYKNISKETNLVTQVAIRAASIGIFSSALISYCVQLSHTTSAYYKTGLIKEV